MASGNKPHILFVYLGKSSFVKEDLRILSDYAEINEFHFAVNQQMSKFRMSFFLLRMFFRQFFWLFRNRDRADLIYCWFADYHAFLPTWWAQKIGIPAVTVLGGFDCIRQESMNYGVFTSSWRRPLATYVINNSSMLLPVDERLIRTNAIAKHWPEAHPNGLATNVPSFATPYRTTPTGYDPSVWQYGPEKREPSVCTVSISNDIRTARRKGIDLVIQTAKRLPEIPFTIVGLSEDVKKYFIKTLDPPANIDFVSAVPRKELNDIYGHSSVYLQLSRAEGLPNVLCEAMMCGCIPVGSAVFGIPYGIGDTGLVAEKPEPEHIAGLIREALKADAAARQKARNRIIEHFSISKRKRALEQLLQDLSVL